MRGAARAAACAAALLLAGCAATGRPFVDEDPVRLPAGADPRVVVEGEGICLLAESWDRETVEVRIRRTAPGEDDLEAMTAGVEADGGTIRIAGRTGDRGTPRSRFILVGVRAPARTALEVRETAGLVFARGFRNGLAADLAEGNIGTEDVTGPLDLHTEKGFVDVAGGDGPVRILAGLGPVRFGGRSRGESSLEARHGRLRVVLPPDAGLGVLGVGVEGRIVTEFPGIAVEAEVVSGSIPGPDAGSLHLQCGDGDLEILDERRPGGEGKGGRR